MPSSQWTKGWGGQIVELRRRRLGPTDTTRPGYHGVVANMAKMLRLSDLALLLGPHGVIAAIDMDDLTSGGGKPVRKER